jgi:inosine-uridine nucleoside N-ribohydrolase
MKIQKHCLAWLLLGLLASQLAAAPAKIPVILDTDIGDDIDDTWALALALKSPEIDLKLVVGDYGKPDYRAKLLAKFLETANRTDVAVGLGIELNVGQQLRQEAWIKDYSLDRYPGKVHKDGIQAIIDTVMNSPQQVTLLCIGPVPNIAEVLKREPRVAQKARFVGMHGSVRVGYGGSKQISAEWNVKAHVASCQKVFTAPWEMTITPLDTCGLIQLRGTKYAAVSESQDPIARAIIENYLVWNSFNQEKKPGGAGIPKASSTLFDCVAVYLAYSTDLCVMESIGLRVDDAGFTREDATVKKVNTAIAWKSLPGFEDFLVQRLTK